MERHVLLKPNKIDSNELKIHLSEIKSMFICFDLLIKNFGADIIFYQTQIKIILDPNKILLWRKQKLYWNQVKLI